VAFADFANLLKASIGLDAASIGDAAVERAVLQRVAACGLAGPDAYWQRVCASTVELQLLIEAVVVPETWFFRDRDAFTTLVRLVRNGSRAPHAVRPRRILSIPSSTGEEPYSIVMALFDAGVSASAFFVDAVDISRRAIDVAERGLYRRNSFRAADLGFRARYFDETPDGHQLAERVRRQVRFRQGNLLAPDAVPEPARYDAVFCRNLLIYFDRPTQERAVFALDRLLAPDGVVVVAPCETGVLLNNGFIPLQAPYAFAFRAAGDAAGAALADRNTAARKPGITGRRRHVIVKRPTGAPVTTTAAAPPIAGAPRPADRDVPGPSVINLDEAVELANRGQFEEALERCEQQLTKSGPSAEIFHLMGLVRDASGNTAEAASCYRKALYLDPHHGEVLVHLTLLLEKAGKTSEALLLRQRMNRLQQGSQPKNATTL
jgi:chemotaxis protein methyltransferase WspC